VSVFISCSSFRKFYKKNECKKLPNGYPKGSETPKGYRRSCGKAPRLPLARERFTARDDEHSDFDGNGCCDGFAPHFPHPRRGGVPALVAQGSVFIYFVMPFGFFIIAQKGGAVKRISANICKILSPIRCTVIK
jgi:hypothetical protein